MTEIRLYLGVFDFGDDPRVVTDLLGIEPTQAWAPGTPMPGLAGERGARRRHGRWELASPAGAEAPVDEQLAALLPLLEARSEAIAEAARRYEVGLTCAAYFREVNPGFHLDATLLARLAALRLGLDLDLYCLGARVEEPDEATPAS